MKRTTKILSITMILMGIWVLATCDSPQGPDQSLTNGEMQGPAVTTDQLPMVQWNDEVIRSIRAMPELDEDGQVLHRNSTRPGVDVQEIEFSSGGLVGGENTFGNAVYVPEGALAMDKYIAVQVACTDADNIALFSDGESYMEMIQADLEVLRAGLAEDLEEAEAGDSEYDDDEIEDAIDDIDDALEAIYDHAIYFQLYSYYAQERTFSHMEHDVSRNLKRLAFHIDRGEISMDHFPAIQNISLLTVEAVRALAVASIQYAEQNPDADQNKIDMAWSCISQGDFLDDYDVWYIELEWNYYEWAINRYKHAWKFAGQAIHNLEEPCGAMVDFLPSQQFEADVYVTLSWEVLNFDGDPELLDIYWYNEETLLWELVPNPIIDYDAGTVSVYIDHFTRYAWTVRPPPVGD